MRGVDADQFQPETQIDFDQLPAMGQLAARIVRLRQPHPRARRRQSRHRAGIGDMHSFHRYDNVVAGETDRASRGIIETTFPGELRGLAVDLTRSSGIRGGAVSIGIGGIEGNIEGGATLMNDELKHALPVQKFFVYELAVKL